MFDKMRAFLFLLVVPTFKHAIERQIVNLFLQSPFFLDFDECENSVSNNCHKYADCENVVGTYICECIEGFFGDGMECQGRE